MSSLHHRSGCACRLCNPPGPQPIAPRFWAKVDKNGPERPDGSRCWLWTAGIRKGPGGNGGYGVLRAKGTNLGAHVVSWFLHYGVWPTKCVLHTCDTRRCVNPAHLFEGTRAENNADRDAKGRTSRGEKHHAKLTESAVRRIRTLRAEGWKHRELSAEFGISLGYVSAIVERRKWAHVT